LVRYDQIIEMAFLFHFISFIQKKNTYLHICFAELPKLGMSKNQNHISAKSHFACRNPAFSCNSHTRACENHSLRVSITLVHAEITLVLVRITLLRVETTLCMKKFYLFLWKSHSACINHTQCVLHLHLCVFESHLCVSKSHSVRRNPTRLGNNQTLHVEITLHMQNRACWNRTRVCILKNQSVFKNYIY
jgi:hypothetical protein